MAQLCPQTDAKDKVAGRLESGRRTIIRPRDGRACVARQDLQHAAAYPGSRGSLTALCLLVRPTTCSRAPGLWATCDRRRHVAGYPVGLARSDPRPGPGRLM